VEVYDFEVLKSDAIITAKQSIALPDPSAAWPKVVKLAKTFNEPGCTIRVKDGSGGIVILIGVTAIRGSSDTLSLGRRHRK
jgi:hypothetical protein